MGRRGAQLVPGDVIGVDLALTRSKAQALLIRPDPRWIWSQKGKAVRLIQLVHFPTKTASDGTVVSVIAEEIEQGQVSVQ